MTVRYYEGCDRRGGTFVLGHEFGPCLIAHHTTLDDAQEEYDEHFGHKVDTTDPALLDYARDERATDWLERSGHNVEDWHEMPESMRGAMVAESIGDIRMNSGGSLYWTSNYEWAREFSTLRAAVAYCLELAGISPLEFAR